MNYELFSTFACRKHCHGLSLVLTTSLQGGKSTRGKSGQHRTLHWWKCQLLVTVGYGRREWPPCSGKVRVRRWCKRPPADGWSSGCSVWRLQVRVYHRLRAVRPKHLLRWRVECLSRWVTCGVDKWQTPRKRYRTRLIGTVLFPY